MVKLLIISFLGLVIYSIFTGRFFDLLLVIGIGILFEIISYYDWAREEKEKEKERKEKEKKE